MVLQKSDPEQDKKISEKGEFFTRAKAAGTDKIFGDHQYQLEYHRYLDTLPKEEVGMMLEIGLGCTMNYGPGASTKIWPHMFPHLALHMVELNRACTEKWSSS